MTDFTPLVRSFIRSQRVIAGSGMYKFRLISAIKQEGGLDEALRYAYGEMLVALIVMLKTSGSDDKITSNETSMAEAFRLIWREIGETEPLFAAQEIRCEKLIGFADQISQAGQDLEDSFSGDLVLETLQEPARFGRMFDAILSDMTMYYCTGLWHDRQMVALWSGLSANEQAANAYWWSLWRRCAAGGKRRVWNARECMHRIARNHYQRTIGPLVHFAPKDNAVYNYFNDAPEDILTIAWGPRALDPAQLAAGDAALQEVSPFTLAGAMAAEVG